MVPTDGLSISLKDRVLERTELFYTGWWDCK